MFKLSPNQIKMGTEKLKNMYFSMNDDSNVEAILTYGKLLQKRMKNSDAVVDSIVMQLEHIIQEQRRY